MSDVSKWPWWVANFAGQDVAFKADIPNLDDPPEIFRATHLTFMKANPDGKVHVFPWLVEAYNVIRPTFVVFRSNCLVLCHAESKLIDTLENAWKPMTPEEVKLSKDQDVEAALRDAKVKAALANQARQGPSQPLFRP